MNVMRGRGLDSSGSRQGQVAGYFEFCNELSSFIKRGEGLE